MGVGSSHGRGGPNEARRTRVIKTLLSGNFIKELCDWKGEGIVGVRDSPSRRWYPGQIDQGFDHDEGLEVWRARDQGRPKLYRAMGLENRPDKTIRLNDGLRSRADDVR